MNHDWLELWKSTLKFKFVQQIALKVNRSCLFCSIMVKGFKDGKGTFHPIGQSKGVRSRRDTSKTEGVKIRNKRYAKEKKFKPILDEDGDIDVNNKKNQERLEEIIEEETARREEKLIENEDAYEELLNSGTDDVTAMGVTVGAGTFLREHDPIAFRESLLNYADGTRPEIEQEVREEIDEEDSLEGNRFLTLSILSPEQRFSQ